MQSFDGTVTFTKELVGEPLMSKLKLDLSPAEWEIMEVIWAANEPLTIREVVDTAYPSGEKAYTTVQTLMNILVEKKILRRRKDSGMNRYASVVSREAIVKRSLHRMVQHMFAGSTSAMAAFLVNASSMSQKEIAELKELLEKKGGTG